MRKLSGLLLLLLLASSCKKEKSDFLWARSFGQGDALYVSSAPDSGILSCGTIHDNPYFIKLTKNKSTITEYTSGREGLFSSAWDGDSCFIAAGSSNGKMLLGRINKEGSLVWDTTITAGFNVELTTLASTGNGTFLALGSAAPASYETGASGLLFIRFDTAGNITEEKEISGTDFISANNLITDNQGNILIALTRKTGSAKPRACVTKYNADIQKLWETELYNNTSVGAASLAVAADQSGNVYVTGKTEVTREAGTLDNSFLAALDRSGEIIWKKYLENSNSGAALLIDESDLLWMLNRNCFIVNKFSLDTTDPVNVTDEGQIRTFAVCDSYNTDALGADISLFYDGNILVAGSVGGNYYLAVKSSSQ